MAENDEIKKPNIIDMLEAHRREREQLAWEGTFREYFELVNQQPRYAQLSHARVCDMILSAGVEKVNEGSRDEVMKPLQALVDRLLRYKEVYRFDAKGRGVFLGRPRLDFVTITKP